MQENDAAANFHDYTDAVGRRVWSGSLAARMAVGHDLGLGAWGPFGKRFFGISHLPGPAGARVDWMVVPELYRRSLHLPHGLKHSGYLPWRADPDLRRYGYRQWLENAVRIDIDFAQVSEAEVRIRVDWTNEGDRARDLRLHLISCWSPPALGSWRPRSLRSLCIGEARGGAVWVDALAYAAADLGNAAWPWAAGLAYDGARPGQVFEDGLVDAQGLLWPEEAEKAWVEFAVPGAFRRGGRVGLRATGAATAVELRCLPGGERLSLALGKEGCGESVLPAGCELLRMTGFAGTGRRVLDGLWFRSGNDARPEFVALPEETFAEATVSGGRVRLDWPAPVGGYEVEGPEGVWLRRYRGELETVLMEALHNHVSRELGTEGPGRSHDCVFPVVRVAAGASLRQEIRLRRPGAPAVGRPELVERSAPVLESQAGRFRYGVDRLSAVLLTNLVYPVRLRGQTIRHFTPGRRWDSLYTWDCGLIALGLAELSPLRSAELLNTYLTAPEDSECAFVHHGSPVPTQAYALHELWQKTQDRDLLAYFYPRLCRFLRYLSGEDPRASTRPFRNRLIRTWELFYNSGGWDDYPPQDYLRSREALRSRTATMVMSSHLAAAARILEQSAIELGEDPTEWRGLACGLVADMEALAWDEDEGHYGYLVHDSGGEGVGLLRHEASGRSFNLGLDGLSPLLAGGLRPERRDRLIAALRDEARFLTPMGLSTVDRTAPYYETDGYWNGTVWIPYQYLFWKALLDAGQANFARELAQRVLGHYDAETRDGRACFEHFMIGTGRGAGWHHFGGLSAPLLAMFAAYCVSGRITTGPSVWVVRQEWAAGKRGVRFKVRVGSGDRSVCLVTHDPSVCPSVRIDGSDTKAGRPYPGMAEIPLATQDSQRELTVELS